MVSDNIVDPGHVKHPQVNIMGQEKINYSNEHPVKSRERCKGVEHLNGVQVVGEDCELPPNRYPGNGVMDCGADGEGFIVEDCLWGIVRSKVKLETLVGGRAPEGESNGQCVAIDTKCSLR